LPSDDARPLPGMNLRRDDWHMTAQLGARLERAEPPIDGHDHLRLRKYRAR